MPENGGIMSRASGILFLGLFAFALAQGADERKKVEMPAQVQEMLLANMRDHLATLEKIIAFLAQEQYSQAAAIAKEHLGMEAMHGMCAPVMAHQPPEMRHMSHAMHDAADAFAQTAQNKPKEALGALSSLSQTCVSCHNAYRLR